MQKEWVGAGGDHHASLRESGTPAIAFIRTGPPVTGTPRGHRAAINRDLATRMTQTQSD